MSSKILRAHKNKAMDVDCIITINNYEINKLYLLRKTPIDKSIFSVGWLWRFGVGVFNSGLCNLKTRRSFVGRVLNDNFCPVLT